MRGAADDRGPCCVASRRSDAARVNQDQRIAVLQRCPCDVRPHLASIDGTHFRIRQLLSCFGADEGRSHDRDCGDHDKVLRLPDRGPSTRRSSSLRAERTTRRRLRRNHRHPVGPCMAHQAKRATALRFVWVRGHGELHAKILIDVIPRVRPLRLARTAGEHAITHDQHMPCDPGLNRAGIGRDDHRWPAIRASSCATTRSDQSSTPFGFLPRRMDDDRQRLAEPVPSRPRRAAHRAPSGGLPRHAPRQIVALEGVLRVAGGSRKHGRSSRFRGLLLAILFRAGVFGAA